MRIINLTIFFMFFAMMTSTGQVPNWQWAVSAGGPGNETASAVCTDASGNVYITGQYSNAPITFGTTVLPNAGSGDVFIVKYDGTGNVIWAKKAGGIGAEYGNAITVDPAGNILVTGSYTSATITFGTTVLVNSVSGKHDFFIVKYDPSGNVIWAKSVGGSNEDESLSIASDANGNFCVTGYFSSLTVNLGPAQLTNTTNTNDIFILKYDSAANLVWTKTSGGFNVDKGLKVIFDASGNAVVTGLFGSSSVSFGTYTLTNTSQAGNNLFCVKYDPIGTILWAFSEGGTQSTVSTSLNRDAAGNIYLSGTFFGDSLLLGTTVLYNTNSASVDIFIAKYNSSGNFIWAKSAGGTGFDAVNSIAVDANSAVLLGGTFTGTSITLDTLVLTNAGTSQTDFFLAKYDAGGYIIWANSFGGAGIDGGNIYLDHAGELYATGWFQNPGITFGPYALTSASNNGYDVFVAKMGNVTGIEQVSFSESTLIVYPNPGNGIFNIESSETISELIVLDAAGRELKRVFPGTTQAEVRLDLPGVYYLHLESKSGLSFRKVIVSD